MDITTIERSDDVIEQVHDTMRKLITDPLRLLLAASLLGYLARGSGFFDEAVSAAIGGAADFDEDMELAA